MRISDWSSDVCSSDLDGFWITKALCGFGNFRHRSGHGRPHLAPACLCRQCHADHGPKRAVVVHVPAEGCAPKPVREGSEDDQSPYWARIGWIGGCTKARPNSQDSYRADQSNVRARGATSALQRASQHVVVRLLTRVPPSENLSLVTC